MATTSTHAQPTGAAFLRLALLGAVIGVPAAFLAALFLALVHDLEHWLWHDLPESLGSSAPPWYLVVGLPVAGALVVLLARTFLPGDGGHAPLDGIAGAPTPVACGPGVALAAIGTLAFGGVLGPEGPLIALGSMVGVAVSRVARASARESSVLASAGSFSAISALFGGPVIAGVLMMEASVGLGSAATPMLVLGFVAAATGYLIFVGFGDWGGLNVPGLAVPDLPAYNGTHIRDLLFALAVGVVAALVIHAVREGAAGIALRGPGRLGIPVLLLGGGLAVGVLAELADLLGANSQDVLFSGQASVPALVATDSTKIVLILLVAKALGYAICLGCGFRGGPVFPAIFLGIALMTLPVVWFDLSPTLAVAAGAAAGMAAMTRLLLTSMLFAALLVGTAGLDAAPAAVLAAVAAWLTISALGARNPAARVSEPQVAQQVADT
jgi:H+/Cl- antiporter ClcA